MGEAVVAPFVDDLVADADFLGRGRGAKQSHVRTLPPGLVRIFLDAARHCNRAIRDLARIVDAQKLALLVRKRVAVVLIECSPAFPV